jgi:hypothetical protein
LDVVVLDAPRELTLALPPGRLAWTWRFALAAEGAGTRLTIGTHLSLRVPRRPLRPIVWLLWRSFDVGHGVMERVQLATLARRIPAARRGPSTHG